MKLLLTGNEAVTLGIMDAGASFASAYPGTPSTEITEELAKHKDRIYAEWAPNEKTALEGAIGASYAGARAAACMKQGGLNVAADPCFTCAATGVNAGLVLICADEPGIHSSQNEQDNRWYALHANIPMLEPSDSQECYDMVRSAYEVSEKYATIVLIRMTTRVCHSKSVVTPAPPEPQKIIAVNNDPARFVPVPANARRHKAGVLDRAAKLALASSESGFNYALCGSKKIGVVASGVCYEYAREVFGEDASYFKVGFSHPMPYARIKSFAQSVETLYVIEEDDPYMETLLAASGVAAIGKALFPAQGELTPDVIRRCVTGATLPVIDYDKSVIPNRAPALCAGCPHRGIFYILGKQKNIYLSGDIGCYTLGFAPPVNAIHSVPCMGASISAAHGAERSFTAH
jgi:indolepyruvate ferredoxin oxidoreductase alpha subunit